MANSAHHMTSDRGRRALKAVIEACPQVLPITAYSALADRPRMLCVVIMAIYRTCVFRLVP